MLTTIIIGIVALIAGYYFIKKFDKIDDYFFGSIPGYEPFGRLVVYFSAIIGAIVGATVAIVTMTNANLEWNVVCTLVSIYFSIMLCASIYQAFIFLEKPAHILGKSLFMTFSCAFALAIGFVGSIVVIIVLVVCAILWIALKMLASGGSSSVGSSSSSSSSSNDEEKYTITDENGYERTLKKEGFGTYKDDKGDRWKDGDSWGSVQRDK